LGTITNFYNICFGSHETEGALDLAGDLHDNVQAFQPISCPGASLQHESTEARCTGQEIVEMRTALLTSLPALTAAALQVQTGCPLEKGEIFFLCTGVRLSP